MIKTVEKLEEFNHILETDDAVLFYFSHAECNVCKVLKPKVQELVQHEFPNMSMYYADTVLAPEIAGQNSVFAVPTILAFFGGREYIRKSRNIGLLELAQEIERPYEMVFGSEEVEGEEELFDK